MHTEYGVPVTKDLGASARIISIGGGKGGVGKSIVAVNLATVIARDGHRVILADLDLGAANQHLLLGVDRPKPGIRALLGQGGPDLADVLTDTSQPNLKLIAGSGPAVGAANISHAEKLRIIRKLRALPADVVIIDVGAGVGYNALDFFELGSQRIIVATPQVTSIHDAYSFLKGAVLRTLRHHAEKSSDVALLERANASGEGEKVSELLARLKDVDPPFAAKVFDVLKNFGAYLVGNQLADPAQAAVFHAVSKMMLDYLGVSVPILGWIKASPRLYESVNRRTPLGVQDSGEEERAFRAIADALLVDDVPMVNDDVLLESDVDPDAEDAEMVPDALAVAARSPQTMATVTDGEPVTPHVYVRPPRKPPKPQKEKKRAAEGRRVRSLTLPGMTPVKSQPARGGSR